MRTWARWTARTAMISASFAAAGVGTIGIASADTHITSGSNSLLGGNQINVPISVSLNACGNALALLGQAAGPCQGGASVDTGSGDATGATSGDNSLLGGNQINAPVSAPADLCGNGAAVLGQSQARCPGGATVGSDDTTPAPASTNGGGAAPTQRTNPGGYLPQPVDPSAPVFGPGSVWWTSIDNSILGGNQLNLPISIPVDVCGNTVAVLGQSLAGCQGGATAHTDAVWKTSSSTLSGLTGLLSAVPASTTPATLLAAHTSTAPGMGAGALGALAASAVAAGAAAFLAATRRFALRKASR